MRTTQGNVPASLEIEGGPGNDDLAPHVVGIRSSQLSRHTGCSGQLVAAMSRTVSTLGRHTGPSATSNERRTA